uniref:Uncharacterized LOC100183484 n=1 Tax=Ciona intestinalis TaxID=7719 RepID=H2XZC8_CIOIN|nr:uncharacterized protein LOC100183484 [Ciona intestinalis]|eukprot:XP_002121391.1 uncharacterized protein LOC100183484 [Ciona intestinalis]
MGFSCAVCVILVSIAAQVWASCLTNVDADKRIDCYPKPYDQSTCEANKCVWCTGEASNIPTCFINETEPFKIVQMAASNCQSKDNCKVKVDCHPDIITYQPSEELCTTRGCLWFGSDAATSEPKCVYYNNSIVSAFPVFPGVFPIYEIASTCTSCETCTNKVQCLAHIPSDQVTAERCVREGCLWCECTNECIVAGTSALATLGSQCYSCDNCTDNAYMVASNSDDCKKHHGTWCEKRDTNKQCIVLHDVSEDDCTIRRVGEENCKSCTTCEEIFDCSTSVNETAVTCELKGCLWCSNTANQSTCRYGSNGYTCMNKDVCGVQYPRYQDIEFKISNGQRPHTTKLMEVLCYTQLGIWSEDFSSRCISASPLYLAPLFRDIEDNASLA